MRTTLSLDDDIAVLIERRQKTHNQSLKTVVNEGLRRGLSEKPVSAPDQRFSTPSVSLGRALVPHLDNIAEILAVAEGDRYQ